MDHKYIGTETRDGLTVTVHSTSDGKPVTSALELRLDLRNHSPDGFGCGYYGSGPAQLALAILAHQAGDETALRLYQDFKAAVIARLPRDTTWTITGQQVVDWLKSQGAAPEAVVNELCASLAMLLNESPPRALGPAEVKKALQTLLILPEGLIVLPRRPDLPPKPADEVDSLPITHTFSFPLRWIADLIVGAIEGGSNYWCDGVILKSAWPANVQEDICWYNTAGLYSTDFEIEISEIEEGIRGRGRVHRVTRADLHHTIRLFVGHYPDHYADLVNGDWDATTADVFLQLLALGEVIYG